MRQDTGHLAEIDGKEIWKHDSPVITATSGRCRDEWTQRLLTAHDQHYVCTYLCLCISCPEERTRAHDYGQGVSATATGLDCHACSWGFHAAQPKGACDREVILCDVMLLLKSG